MAFLSFAFLKDFTPRSRLVIHSDGDLFSSTLYTLATLDPLLHPGSILIFDEFANPLNEWRAFYDYASAFGRKCKILGAAGDYYTQVALEILQNLAYFRIRTLDYKLRTALARLLLPAGKYEQAFSTIGAAGHARAPASRYP